MAVEEVFVPVGAVFGVCKLGVEPHYRGKELGDEEDQETREEGGIDGESEGGERGFTLDYRIT